MTATQELIRDLKLWACSPRVPTNAQLVMLEAIGRLSAPTEVAPLIELLREIRHAADLGYHGGKNTRAHCKDCELANRIDAAVSPQREKP